MDYCPKTIYIAANLGTGVGEVLSLKDMYAVKDRKGNILKVGLFTEPEVRMAAKAGLLIFRLNLENKSQMEITEELTGLFNKRNPKKESD